MNTDVAEVDDMYGVAEYIASQVLPQTDIDYGLNSSLGGAETSFK